MTTIDQNIGAQNARPKTLTAASLIQRATLGLFLLSIGIVGSALLYDAGIKANAGQQADAVITAPAALVDRR